jgi:hypothetical protein
LTKKGTNFHPKVDGMVMHLEIPCPRTLYQAFEQFPEGHPRPHTVHLSHPHTLYKAFEKSNNLGNGAIEQRRGLWEVGCDHVRLRLGLGVRV